MLQRWGGADALLLWLACLGTICAGYYIAFGLLANAIERQHELTERIGDRLLADHRNIAQRPQLAEQEQIIDNHLRAFDLRADTPTTVARFIRVAARITATQGVSLDQVDERGAASIPPAATSLQARPTAQSAFEPIPIDVTLSGTYDQLLRVIRDLAQAPVALQIDIAAIERTSSPAGRSADRERLTARLHLMLQRLSAPAPAGVAAHPLLEDTTHARPI